MMNSRYRIIYSMKITKYLHIVREICFFVTLVIFEELFSENMTSENNELLLCYNMGCGNKFNPNDNKEDSCTFHPGNPVFHDAYKSWSCCNKKSTDFTEFLNIKGCTKSFHSNVKPPKPEKPAVDKSKANEVIEYKAPVPKVSKLVRHPFDSPLTKMKPEVASSLKAQMENLVIQKVSSNESGEISIGTTCKNEGCRASYEGPQQTEGVCVYHPGVPVFHEGLKCWSCCQNKTTDFSSFLDQVGCKKGSHKWIKEKTGDSSQTVCRYDWHQTGSHVVISVYAKKYDPLLSSVELNPVRAKIHLHFPEDNSSFDKDMELCGIVDVEKSQVAMLQTKVEIKMKKKEPGSWSKLDIPRTFPQTEKKEEIQRPQNPPQPEDEPVDLSDIH